MSAEDIGIRKKDIEQIVSEVFAKDREYFHREEESRALADTIRQVSYEIHRYLGTGFLEKVYENALKHRLELRGHSVQQQVKLTVHDEDGFIIGNYEADLIVDQKIIVELKAVKALDMNHEAQLINYLKATGIRDGMLVNFGSEKFEVRKRIYGKSVL